MNRIIFSNDKIHVLDTKTNLVFSPYKNNKIKLNYREALDIVISSHSKYRIPTVAELLSLLDDDEFPYKNTYWTSTNYPNQKYDYYIIDLLNKDIKVSNKDLNNHLLLTYDF